MTRALLNACRQAMQFSQGVFPPTDWTHLIAAIDAELAKPEQQESRPYEQQSLELCEICGDEGAIFDDASGNFQVCICQYEPESQQQERRPVWHDAPTEPGLWLSDDFDSSMMRFNASHLQQFKTGNGMRWYGPIPEDVKP